jgi:predicted RNase H-like nuclease (RuvC/YqgF family)
MSNMEAKARNSPHGSLRKTGQKAQAARFRSAVECPHPKYVGHRDERIAELQQELDAARERIAELEQTLAAAHAAN